MQGSLLPSFNITDPVVSEKMSFEVIVHKFVKFTTPATPGRGQIFTEGIHLNKLDSTIVADATCQISLNSLQRFRRRFFKVFSIFSNGGHLGFPIDLI